MKHKGVKPKTQSKTALARVEETLQLDMAERRNISIGAFVNDRTKTLTIFRGDFSEVTVPLHVFPPTSAGVKADFTRVEIIDHGHGLRFGAYESSADAVLWEGDPAFRKAWKAKLRAQDRSLGGSMRRLRLQRKLSQSDFAPLFARTIARIENGDVAKPSPATLARIASRLKVRAEELGTY